MAYHPSTLHRDQIRHIFQYMDNGYFEVDLGGRLTFCNLSLIGLFGYDESAIYTKRLAELSSASTAKAIEKAMIRVLKTGEPVQDLSYTFFHAQGAEQTGVMSVCLLNDERSQAIGFYGLIKDLTKIRDLEENLQINQAGLERMISSRTIEMKEEIEQKKYVKTINHALFSISSAINTSKNLDELFPIIHQHLNEIIQMDHFFIGILDREREVIQIQYRVDPGSRLLKDLNQIELKKNYAGKVVKESLPLLMKKEELVEKGWSTDRFGPVPETWLGIPLTSQDRIIGIMIAYSDNDPNAFSNDDFQVLTSVSGQVGFAIERRQILDQLSAREEKYRRLIETTTTGYWQLDKNGVTLDVNQALCQLLGYSKTEIIGHNAVEFIDQQSERVYQIEYEQRSFKKDRQYELVFRKKNNDLLYAKIDATSVFDDQDQFTGSFAMVTDITDRILFQKEISKAKERAEEASKAKSQFLANISHEIRTPLNGVIGMAELLMESHLADEHKNLVETIGSEAESLLGIINTILDFSKIEAGKMELEQIPFDLRNLFEEFSRVIAIRAGKENLEFLSYLDPDIPASLKGDPGRLRQILMNLVGNALKFTPDGEIFISGKLVSQTFKKVVVWFEVADTGIGIPKDKQGMVFQSFSQADGSMTRKYGGTGLGTTISKQLVEMMGGEIGLESAPGIGSKFWFIIGFDKHEHVPAELKAEQISTDLAGTRIMVVENNETHQYILSKYLQSMGCTPLVAWDGQKGMELLERSSNSEPVDIILVDNQLPDQGGFEFSLQVRRSQVISDIPIVLMTATGVAGDGKKCRDIGIDGYLAKPIRKKDLQMAVASVLGMVEVQKKEDRQLVTRHYLEELKTRDLKILVVEDYPTNQQIALKHLSSEGFDVTLAENGAEAVKWFKKAKFDLILMDIQMPVMDGYGATREIRKIEERVSKKHEKSYRIPIIATTAHAMKGYKDKCIQAQMDDYLTKPLKRKDLISMVKAWILQAKELKDQVSVPQDFPSDEVQNFPIDLYQALEEFDNDTDFFNEVLGEFIQEVGRQIKVIRNALDDLDFSVITRESHSIKGGAANLIARPISSAAYALEKIGKAKDTNGLESGIDTLEKAYQELVTYIEKR